MDKGDRRFWWNNAVALTREAEREERLGNVRRAVELRAKAARLLELMRLADHYG